MKAIIVFKLCRDPKGAVILPDGSADWGNSSLAASDDDFRCTQIARELGAQITGLTIGTGDQAWAAARGADETFVITDMMPDADLTAQAAALAAAVRRIGGADLILIGDGSWEPSLPVLLGAELGLNTLAGIVEAQACENGYKVRRRLSTGEQDLQITGPALFGISAKEGEETPPGLKQVLIARKKPVTKLTLSDLETETASKVCVTGHELPASTDAEMITADTPEETVRRLFSKLSEEGVL